MAGTLRLALIKEVPMRLVLPMAALMVLAVPAYAQMAPSAATATPVPAQAGSATAVPPTVATNPPTPPVVHHRETMEERFAKANATHDGHLTLAQAKTGYPTVARHFAEIDTAKKGYVTEDEIKAWEKAERAQHRAAQPAATPPPSKG
jgi:hypothetical protein